MDTVSERRVFHGQGVRGGTIFDPALERLEDGGWLAAEAVSAVTQTRRLEEAPEALDIREERPSLVVEVLSTLGRNTGIGLFGKCAVG